MLVRQVSSRRITVVPERNRSGLPPAVWVADSSTRESLTRGGAGVGSPSSANTRFRVSAGRLAKSS